MTTSSCSPRVRSPTRNSWSTSTICWPQARSQNSTPPMRKNRSSTQFGTKSRARVKSTPGTIPTAGTGISIRSSRNCTCPSASHLWARVSGEEPGSSRLLSTPQSSTGSSPGPKMPYSMWPTASSRNRSLVSKPRGLPSSNSCPSPSKTSTNCPRSCSKSSEGMSTPPPNPS